MIKSSVVWPAKSEKQKMASKSRTSKRYSLYYFSSHARVVGGGSKLTFQNITQAIPPPPQQISTPTASARDRIDRLVRVNLMLGPKSEREKAGSWGAVINANTVCPSITGHINFYCAQGRAFCVRLCGVVELTTRVYYILITHRLFSVYIVVYM